MIDIDSERSKFEADAIASGYQPGQFIRKTGKRRGEYDDECLEDQWTGWMSAKRSVEREREA